MPVIDVNLGAVYTSYSDPTQFQVTIDPADEALALFVGTLNINCQLGTLNYATRTFPTIPDAQTFCFTMFGTYLPMLVDMSWGTTGSTTGNVYYNLKSSVVNALALKASISSLSVEAFSGAYADISGKPSLSTVATSGSYNDLTSKPTIINLTPATSALTGLSLVGSGATGTQISATKASEIRISVSTSATASIGGAATSVIVLKKCATNSATESDWTEVQRLENDQTITLAIALQSVQTVKGELVTTLPAGWYFKLVNSGTGTHSESIVEAEQTIFG